MNLNKIVLKVSIAFLFLLSTQIIAQQMEVLYVLDYKVSEIIPSNGYHACIAEDELTNNGIFDIYDQNGNFIGSKNFEKGSFTTDPSVNMLGAWVNSFDNSIATGIIDTDTNGYWSALRLYDTTSSPIQEKIAYNTGCIPYLVNGVYYGVFYVLENNDMLNTGWSFPYTGNYRELFIASLNNDLSIGNWVLPLTDLHPNASSIENIQAMPNGNILVSITGDFSPPLDASSKAIEIDSTTGDYIGLLAEGMSGFWDFHKYDYTTNDLYTYNHSIWTLNRFDNNGDLKNYTDWQPYPTRLFNNYLTNIQFVNDEVVGINLFEYGQTTHLSKDLIHGYTTPSFEFNSNFLINSGWMNADASQIIPTIYTGAGMQIGTTTLPNISDWNTVVCKMINTEPLSLRGILNDSDVNIVAIKNHQIYNGVEWVDGYYQSTLIFTDGTVPNIGDTPDEIWVEAATDMEIFSTHEVDEITRNAETFRRFTVWFKKTDATGVNLVEVALEVILKSATEVGISTEEYQLDAHNIKLYPNPVNDIIKLEIDADKAVVEIYNTLGQCIKKQIWTKYKNTLKLTHLKTGAYFLKIKTEKGLSCKKIIKK